MKSILAFFFVVFASLGAGTYFYETQIASPNAADSVVKAKKKKPAKKITKIASVIKNPSPQAIKNKDIITVNEKPSRVIDILAFDNDGNKKTREQVQASRRIDRSIKSSIKKSASLDIQKAVVAEISQKR